MSTTEDKLALIWAEVRRLVGHFNLDADPSVKGPLGLTATQARTMAAYGRLVWIAGGVMRATARADRGIAEKKFERQQRQDSLLAHVVEYNDLREVRTQPGRLKARIAVRLEDMDQRIASLEAAAIELHALQKYLDMNIRLAESTKAILRQQVDVLIQHRATKGAGEFEEEIQ